MARCQAIDEEVVHRCYLLTRQRIMFHDTILGYRFDLDLISSVYLSLKTCMSRIRGTHPSTRSNLYTKDLTESTPRLRRLTFNICLLIEDTLVHRWAAEKLFVLYKHWCRPNIGDLLVFYDEYADLARTVSVLAWEIEWSPKLTSEAQSDQVYKRLHGSVIDLDIQCLGYIPEILPQLAGGLSP